MKISEELQKIFKRKDLIILMGKAYNSHKKMEQTFKEMILKKFNNNRMLEFPNLSLGFKDYFSRNAFSILFLSILDFLTIPRRKILLYGIVIHAIRGIVTNGDNILDHEDKGAFKVKMREGRILSNIFSILLQNGIIYDVVYELNQDPSAMLNALLSGLYAVANGESIDEKEVRSDLSPKEVLDSIHSLRGGALMQLAFIVPETNEPETDFTNIKDAIFHIGLAVQLLDDIVDLFLDLQSGNHNILVSTIIFEELDGKYTKEDVIELSRRKESTPEKIFPNSSKKILDLSIKNANLGFEKLSQTGYPINKEDAMQFLHYLFRVRKVEYLWDL